MPKVRGRPPKPESERRRNGNFSATPKEIAAIHAIAAKRKLCSSFDYVRQLVIKDGDPLAKGQICKPRFKS